MLEHLKTQSKSDPRLSEHLKTRSKSDFRLPEPWFHFNRSADRSSRIARSIASPIAEPIAKSNRSFPTQTSCDLTDPIAALRSHRSQSDRAIRCPIAAPKKPIAADRRKNTCLKSCILQHLSFGTITNPWESEPLGLKTLYFTYRTQYLEWFGQGNPHECASFDKH